VPDDQQQIEIELELGLIVNKLLANKAFMRAVTDGVRAQLLKDARTMKTIFGKWGGTTK